jgi:medium-chain acyl-[acyl-carrier-protein] hydrolase
MHSNFKSIYSENFKINFLQCYSNGSLKYTELFNLLQMVAANHADFGGIGLSDLQKNDQAWVLAKMLVEIENMPKWNEEVTITTWIKSLENSKSIRCFEVLVNDKTIIGCETLWVIINTIKRRPESLVLKSDHFETFPVKYAVKSEFKKPKLLKNVINSWRKKVVLSDLDIVNHVNNIKYIEWCLDGLNAEYVLKNTFHKMEMHFLREMVWNESVAIEEDGETFYVNKDGKNCFIMSIDKNN